MPALVLGELRVAELLAGRRVRERQRQVEVGTARLEGGGEDGRIEARLDRVQDRVRALGPGELRDPHGVRGVDLCGAEPGVALTVDHCLRTSAVDVGEDDPLEDVASPRRRRDGGADPSRSHDEHAHRRKVPPAQGCGQPYPEDAS